MADKKFYIRIVAISLVVGMILACSSIIIGKKSQYAECNFVGSQLNMVDRGFPLSYFRVTPSDSDCKSVENVADAFKSDVGNKISVEAFLGNVVFWSVCSVGVTLLVRKLTHKK